MTLQDIDQRLGDYVDSHGFWFASCPDFLKVALKACEAKLLRPVSDFIDNCPNSWYVPFSIKNKCALPHGLYQHFFEGVPC